MEGNRNRKQKETAGRPKRAGKPCKWRAGRVVVMLCAVLLCVVTAGMPASAASKVKLNATKKTVYIGTPYTLKVSGTKKEVSWSSSNKKVATVSQKGKVTGKKKGTATITAKVGSKKLTCKVTVKQPVTKVKLNKSSVAFTKKGQTARLKTAVKPSSASSKKLKWSTSDKKVATVTQKGVVKAVGNGTCYVYATAADRGKVKAKCLVKVAIKGQSAAAKNTETKKQTEKQEETEDKNIVSLGYGNSISGITLSVWDNMESKYKSGTCQMKDGLSSSIEVWNTNAKNGVLYKMSYDNTKQCTLTSSNTKVLSVEGQKITAESIGTATITCNFKGLTDTIDITVVSAAPHPAVNGFIDMGTIKIAGAENVCEKTENGGLHLGVRGYVGISFYNVTEDTFFGYQGKVAATPGYLHDEGDDSYSVYVDNSIDPDKITATITRGEDSVHQMGSFDMAWGDFSYKAAFAGTSTVEFQYNGKTIAKLNIRVTSDSPDAVRYESWKKQATSQIWNSSMTVYEKLNALQELIQTSFTYGPHCTMYDCVKVMTCDCWNASRLFCDIAESELGVDARYVAEGDPSVYIDDYSKACIHTMLHQTGDGRQHMFNVVLIDGKPYWYDATPYKKNSRQ